VDEHDLSPAEISVEDLTWREQEVLALVAERLTNREIGDRLHLTENTVKAYVGNILGKLYVKNRRQAVERAKELGLLKPDTKMSFRPSHNLPAEPTPFIGRTEQLAEISRLLSDNRLLTLTGPSGIGKTRLALRAAAHMVDIFTGGAYFVSLAPISSLDSIVQAIAESIGFPLSTQESPRDQLLRHLRNRQYLLVLDNFEHLLEGAGLLSEILQAAPDVTILATSRERLHLQEETLLPIEGLAVPEKATTADTLEFSAVQLFLQSAKRVQPDFEIQADDVASVISICQLVEGFPLGILLAAAWVDVLSLKEISDEISDSLDFLQTELRNVPDRHRSVRAAFEPSWRRLTDKQRALFARLSVFRGGFTREAAEQVADASLSGLASLVSKSLLRRDPNMGRYEIHELLRQYAQEQLELTPQGSTAAHEAHATYYANFMQQRGQHLKDNRQIVALSEIEADIENVRTAWRYRVNQGNAAQMRMFLESFRFLYDVRGWTHAGMELFREAVEALRDAASDDEEAVIVKAVAQANQGYFMAFLGLSEQGYELAKEGVETLESLDHPLELAVALNGLSLTSYYLTRYDEEDEISHRMLEIATEHDDKSLMAFALDLMCMVAIRLQDYAKAKQLAESSLRVNEDVGDAVGSVLAFLGLGHAAFGLGEYAEAKDYFLRSLSKAEELGYRWAIANSLKYVGWAALAMDEIAEAKGYFVQSLRIADEIGLGREMVNLMYEFARVRVAEGNSERAVELLALTLQHPASHQARLGSGPIRDSMQALLATLEAKLSPEIYAAASSRGATLELDEAVVDILRGLG
jgi:predicted ATPase/DNA-binding CsgD family transcriptional regulator